MKQRFGIIGNTEALSRAIDVAIQVAPTDLSVLITGESGVGKESFPQIIHQYSRRKHGQYIAVNCGAIPEGTIDSELFGHEKGAFTGAIGERKGYFGEADGGTIFLDEVGELPMSTQARLLRVLESGEFMKVGSSKVQKTDVRVVAATNVNLTQAIAEGRFREDLYYRLNTVPIQIPPLRERGDDVLLLFRKFSADFAEKYRMPAIQLTEDAKKELLAYPWPGNVRELRHTIERACAAAGDGTQLFTRHLPTEIRIELARKRLVHLSESEESAPTAPLPEQEPSTQPRKPETFPTLRDMKAKAERDYIAGLFAACQGDVRRAAGIAGVSRGHFYELLKKYGLDRTSSIPEFPAI